MPRSTGLFIGSLLSSRYSATRPTCARQTRRRIVRPGKSSETCSHPPPRASTGWIGRLAGSLYGYISCCQPRGVDDLPEVPDLVEEPYAHHRHAEVARSLEIVAGQDAEAAGVERQALAETELHAEVRDALEPRPGIVLRVPARLAQIALPQRRSACRALPGRPGPRRASSSRSRETSCRSVHGLRVRSHTSGLIIRHRASPA